MSKVISVEPQDLLPNPWNTNVMSPASEQKLDNSLRRFGCFKPVLVREILVDEEKKLEIIGGEHRAQSAVRVGLKKINAVNLGSIGDKEAKEISLADNARYGADDTLALAELLRGLGSSEELREFLPFTEDDITSIFSAETIDLGELELDANFDKPEDEEKPIDPKIPKAPKTHTIMRFKVTLGDAERLTDMIVRTQQEYNYTAGDDLTNAGDALVHLLIASDED